MNLLWGSLGILTVILLSVSVIFLVIWLRKGTFREGLSILGTGDFWWKYFKPIAAVPIAWGLFHLCFILMYPDASRKIWTLYWKQLMVIEFSALTLCIFLNRKTPFENRPSRKLLTAAYILFFTVAGITIGCRLSTGEFANNLNKVWKQWQSPTEAQAQPRHLSGIFNLPADGRIVSQDVNGKELQYNELEYVRFQQLGSPGKFTVVNRKPLHSNWTTDRQTVTSSRTKYSDKVRLMSADGKPKTIQVRIIPRRS